MSTAGLDKARAPAILEPAKQNPAVKLDIATNHRSRPASFRVRLVGGPHKIDQRIVTLSMLRLRVERWPDHVCQVLRVAAHLAPTSHLTTHKWQFSISPRKAPKKSAADEKLKGVPLWALAYLFIHRCCCFECHNSQPCGKRNSFVVFPPGSPARCAACGI